MSVGYQVPVGARYFATNARFDAPFNPPSAPGMWDFAAATQDVVILAMQPNTMYLVESLSVGGDVAADDFYDAISVVPQLSLRITNPPNNVFPQPIPVVGYMDARECATFVHSDVGGNSLALSLTGIMRPTPALLGRPTLSLSVSFAIYAIDDRTYQEAARAPAAAGPLGPAYRR